MRILIADDESIIRMGLKSMLQQMGHMVVAASNGREALRMAHKHNPDMAILDVKMPFTDGLQAAKSLHTSHPMPVVLLTAFSDSELIEKASALPIHGYLVKPVKKESLEAAMAVAVNRFADQRALQQERDVLERKLETRKLVDRAKGKLMVQKGLDEEQAYRLLQLRARESRSSLADVAAAVLKG